jgi:hypothetical protein
VKEELMEGRKVGDIQVLREVVQLLGWAESGNGRWIHEHSDVTKNYSWDEVLAFEEERLDGLASAFARGFTGAQHQPVADGIIAGLVDRSKSTKPPDGHLERMHQLEESVSNRFEALERKYETTWNEGRIDELERSLEALVVKVQRTNPSCTCDEPGDSKCPVHLRENDLQNRALKAEGDYRILVTNHKLLEKAYGELQQENRRLKVDQGAWNWMDGNLNELYDLVGTVQETIRTLREVIAKRDLLVTTPEGYWAVTGLGGKEEPCTR